MKRDKNSQKHLLFKFIIAEELVKEMTTVVGKKIYEISKLTIMKKRFSLKEKVQNYVKYMKKKRRLSKAFVF